MAGNITYEIKAFVLKKTKDEDGRTVRDQDGKVACERKLCTFTLCANTSDDAPKKLKGWNTRVEEIVSVEIYKQPQPEQLKTKEENSSLQLAVNQ